MDWVDLGNIHNGSSGVLLTWTGVPDINFISIASGDFIGILAANKNSAIGVRFSPKFSANNEVPITFTTHQKSGWLIALDNSFANDPISAADDVPTV